MDKIKKTTGPKVLSCSCVHPFQDMVYGKGKRLMNQTKKQNNTVYRCTVCAKEQSA